MTNQEKFRFTNNGKPYEITIEANSATPKLELYDGNLHVWDDDVLSVALKNEDIILGTLFKRKKRIFYIEVQYKLTPFGSPSCKRISLVESEISDAEKACTKATKILIAIKEKKDSYRIEQDEKIKKAKMTDTIDAIDENGTAIKIWRRETFFGDKVLIADGGESYHTHADCFESWKPMYRRTFKLWKIVNKADAEKQGFRECRLCEKYYDTDDSDD